MAGSIIPFPCLELDVSNSFHVNTTLATLGANVAINTTAFSINTTTVGLRFTQAGIFIGNSTSNVIVNSTAMAVTNGNLLASYGQNLLIRDAGSEAVNATANSTAFAVTNSSGAFFVANTLGIFLGTAGNLANLRSTSIALGDGSTNFSPDRLSIGNSTVNSIMNLTHLNVTTVVGSLTGNFSGNATQLGRFNVGQAGIVNPSTDDANTVLQSNGQWVQPGLFWYDSGRGTINQANLDIFWGSIDYSMVEISGWILPEDDDNIVDFLLSSDGSTFTGFGSNYHQRQRNHFFPGDNTRTLSNDNNFALTPAEPDAGGVRDGVSGIGFIITIHNHHGQFSTVHIKSGHDASAEGVPEGMDMLVVRGWGLLASTTAPQGIRLRFALGGNVFCHSYAVKVFPN